MFLQDWAQAGWTWREVCNLPNSLSLARLASGPFISALIINHNWSTAFVAISVAAITDWLDGAAAKRFHTNSVLGSYLDPLADKVLVCCVVGALGYEVSCAMSAAELHLDCKQLSVCKHFSAMHCPQAFEG